jgi:hypothetical protein
MHRKNQFGQNCNLSRANNLESEKLSLLAEWCLANSDTKWGDLQEQRELFSNGSALQVACCQLANKNLRAQIRVCNSCAINENPEVP